MENLSMKVGWFEHLSASNMGNRNHGKKIDTDGTEVELRLLKIYRLLMQINEASLFLRPLLNPLVSQLFDGVDNLDAFGGTAGKRDEFFEKKGVLQLHRCLSLFIRLVV